MKIMGIDPGTQKLGWGITEGTKTCDYGLIQAKGKLDIRLAKIFADLANVFKESEFDEVAFEASFIHPRRYNNAVPLGRTQGLIIALCELHSKPWIYYSPSEIKKAVYKGNANKQEVARIVGCILDISVDTLTEDITDALATSICHSSKATRKMGVNYVQKR